MNKSKTKRINFQILLVFVCNPFLLSILLKIEFFGFWLFLAQAMIFIIRCEFCQKPKSLEVVKIFECEAG